jgi:hypothetical protein
MNPKQAEEALASAHRRDMKHKQEKHMLAAALTRKGVVALTAGTYGAMDLYGVSKTIKGFPWKIAVWFGATLTEALASGLVQQSAGGVSDVTLGLYLHDAIANKTIIAGDREGGEV